MKSKSTEFRKEDTIARAIVPYHSKPPHLFLLLKLGRNCSGKELLLWQLYVPLENRINDFL